MANRFDLQITITTKKQGDGIAAANREIESFGKRLNNTLTIARNSGVALLAAGAVVKKAFDFAEQGAQLEFLEQKFESLSDSIGSSGDIILAKLDEVTKGTLTTAQQMELASQLISLGLATNEEDVTRLAKVVTGLGLDMSQVILTFANNSVMRLDALGLSVTDVKDRAAALEAQGLDANKAFDTAVLEAAEAKLLLVGSAADSSAGAYLRLRTQIAETTNVWKEQLAQGITPVVEVLAGDYGRAIEDTITRQLEMATSTEKLIELARRLKEQQAGLGDNITGTSDEIGAGLEEVLKRIARSTNGWEEYRAALYEANITGTEASEIVYREIEALIDLERATGIAEQRSEQFARGQEMVVRQEELAAEAAISQGNAYDYMIDRSILLNENMEDYGDTLLHVRENQAKLAATMEFVNDGFDGQRETIAGLFDAYGDLEEASGEYVTTFRNNSGEISTIWEELNADLTDDQQDALNDQLDNLDEFSQEAVDIWNQLQGDLTESQRRELIARLTDLQNTHGESMLVYTGDTEAAEEAQERINAAFAEISAGYRNMVTEILVAKLGDAFNEDVANVMVATGQMSQAQADFLLQVQETQRQVGLVGDALIDTFLEDGSISREEAQLLEDAIAGIEEGAFTAGEVIQALGNDSLETLITQGGLAITEMQTLKERLLAVEGEYPITIPITVTGDEIPDLPSNYKPGDEIPTAHGGYRSAGSTLLVGEEGPEIGVLPEDRYFYDAILTGRLIRNMQGGGGGGRTYVDNSQTTYVVAGREAAALVLAEAHVSRRRRLDSSMGVQ